MTMTDDALVRDLAARVERVAPAMGLDPAAVLAAGRRRRRHAAAARTAALVAVVGAAGAAWTGGLGVTDDAPPAPASTVLTEGLVVTAANAAEVVETTEGEVLRLTDEGGHTFTVRFDAAAGVVEVARGTAPRAQGDEGWLAAFGASADTAEEGEGISQASGPLGDSAIAVGYVSGPGDVRLEWSDGGGTGTRDLPVFDVPGATGRVYVVRVEGAPVDGSWPTVSVVHAGTDEHRADVDLSWLRERVMTAGPDVAVATDVREVDSSAGPALDLGLPVLNDYARPTADGTEDLTWVLLATTWGETTGDASLTAAEAAADVVMVAVRRTFGAVTPVFSAPVANARTDGSPVLAARETPTDVEVLGLLPDGATAATLVVQRAGGEERTALPTFSLPGLPGQHAVFFFTLHGEGSEVAEGRAFIEVAGADGTVTLWSASGDPLPRG